MLNIQHLLDVAMAGVVCGITNLRMGCSQEKVAVVGNGVERFFSLEALQRKKIVLKGCPGYYDLGNSRTSCGIRGVVNLKEVPSLKARSFTLSWFEEYSNLREEKTQERHLAVV